MEEILHFKELQEYPLKSFYYRNKISVCDIAKALHYDLSVMYRFMKGHLDMPSRFDKKLKATALHLSEKKRVPYPLTEKERNYCTPKVKNP